ncbi:MAG: hypothetical protein AAFZ80_00960 [Cyanobacteria bacterium P01_A01_bin.105]
MTTSPIERISQLDTEADYSEGIKLAEHCIETGIVQWTNPKFQYFLSGVVSYYLFRPKKFLRGVIYARWIAETMPNGVNDEFKDRLSLIGQGRPASVMGFADVPAFMPWPARNVYCAPWHGRMFLWSVKAEADARLATDLRRRQRTIPHQ